VSVIKLRKTSNNLGEDEPAPALNQKNNQILLIQKSKPPASSDFLKSNGLGQQFTSPLKDLGIAYYLSCQIDQAKLEIKLKSQILQRLLTQSQAINTQAALVHAELEDLIAPSKHVAIVIKIIDCNRVLINIKRFGKFVSPVSHKVEVNALRPGTRVLVARDSLIVEAVLAKSYNPLVAMIMVDKVQDSSFSLCGGLEKQITKLKEVIELPIKHPELFESLGIAQPKVVILYGAPGTGKALFARAVAHHTECIFIRVSGSELVQKYIGDDSRMVRELFQMAKENVPSIIFIDEIDLIRSARQSGHSDFEMQRTMLELLNQLDGFEQSVNLKIILATNRLDALDSALLRPGCADRKIELLPPTLEGCIGILRIYARNVNLERDTNMVKLATLMVGFSGAEIKAVCTGWLVCYPQQNHVTQEAFELAIAKILSKLENSVLKRKLFK
jgi:26S proteasome regulatory subunit T6